jgi:tetratricopeptide (TPR) repeat protein
MGPKRKKEKTSWLLHHITLIAAVCTILSSVAVFIQFIYPVLRENYRKKALEITFQSAVGEDEVLILVSEFEPLGSYRFNIKGRIVETLQKELREFPDVRISTYPKTVSSAESDQAAEVGRRYNASMLIWGNYDDAGIRPIFAVPRTLVPDPSAASNRYILLEMRTAEAMGLFHRAAANSDSAGEGLVFDDFPSEGIALQDYVRELLPRQMEYMATLFLGVRYFEIGEFDESLAALDKCIRVSETTSLTLGLPEAFLRRGRIRLMKKDLPAALGDLTRAHDLDPGNLKILVDRAYARFLGNDPDSTAADCNTVWESLGKSGSSSSIDAMDSVLLNRLTGIVLAGQGKAEQAFARLENGCREKFDPDKRALAPALAELGVLLNSRRAAADAERILLKSVSLDSTAARPYYWLGTLASETRRDTLAACSYFRKYAALEKDTSAVSRLKVNAKGLNCPF